MKREGSGKNSHVVGINAAKMSMCAIDWNIKVLSKKVHKFLQQHAFIILTAILNDSHSFLFRK